ncbi:hypothetical protein, partial [Pseudomonas aeruginosa]
MTNPTTSIEDVPLNAFHRLLTLRSGGGPGGRSASRRGNRRRRCRP